MSYHEHRKCRACSSTELIPVFDMREQPLANDHCLPGEARQGFYPLKVLFCDRCGLAQLSVVVNRDQLYRHYSYVSSTSATMARHYDRLFLDICSEEPEKTIVEIASNDGGLLQFAKTKEFEVIGIDPARNLAKIAMEKGIDTISEFFDVESAKMARSRFREPGVILARHVFAHIDDWHEFFQALEVLAGESTLIVLEFPYVLDMMQKNSWDTIYHEHLSIISLRPVVEVLKGTPFHIHRISKVGVHGGALVMMLRHNKSKRIPHLSADEMIADESITKAKWDSFALEAESKIANIRDVVVGLAGKGEVVSGFGASAKSTVMIRACGLTSEHIQFVTDNSPFKPGRLIPGTQIPIVPEDEILSRHADYSLLSAWNFKLEILDKMKEYRRRGGKFIIPERELEVV